MDSVTKTTILDFVGNWLPWECSVCRNNGSAIKFAWWTDPILCWECAEAAPQDVRQRLQRVKVARHALGFENFSLYDLEKALWPGRGRFSVIMDQRMPPVFGRSFTSPLLRKGQVGGALLPPRTQ